MWIKRFEGEQKQASSSSSNILQMRAEIQDLELQIANLQTKVKTQTEQSDYLTEQLSVAQATINEKIIQIEENELEMENVKTVHETVLNQKKDYIKKLFIEMDELRQSIAQKVQREQMIQEDFRITAHVNLHESLRHQERARIRDDRIEQLLQDKDLVAFEINRMMMESEDTLGQYHREWKISDERRYLLARTEQALQDERHVREKLKKDFEEAKKQFDSSSSIQA